MRRYSSSLGTTFVASLVSVAVSGCAAPLAAPPAGPYGTSIQAAADGGFSDDRAASLKQLAESPLNPAEQCYLVDAVAHSGMFSDDRQYVLIALIANPGTTSATLEYIPSRLDEMHLFSDDRREVLEAVIATQSARQTAHH
ncbi:MAG: hypothetical protein SGJ09_01260 [Phycisphaerae bacterium]|nr:hypothetical protein [Phycisphaerae bacterium]